ncbi:hypothetical protein ACHAWF_010413, partial [Thalassiosira exigua]
ENYKELPHPRILRYQYPHRSTPLWLLRRLLSPPHPPQSPPSSLIMMFRHLATTAARRRYAGIATATSKPNTCALFSDIASGGSGDSSTPTTTDAIKGTGTVTWFDNKKGYGFITPADGSDNLFVHWSEIHAAKKKFKVLDDGEEVEFDVAAKPDGRLMAVRVTGPDGANVKGRRSRPKRDDVAAAATPDCTMDATAAAATEATVAATTDATTDAVTDATSAATTDADAATESATDAAAATATAPSAEEDKTTTAASIL